MSLRQSLLALLLVLAALPAGAGAAPAPTIGESAVLGDHYPERHIAFPPGVSGYPDLVYRTVNGFRPLTLDLYAADQGAAERPLVIYVHGGGWMGGHSRQSGAFEDWPGVLASLAAKGYVVASLNYRLSSEARFPAAEQDVKAAIRWLRANAGRYHIDKKHVVIWGGSAGGQLAALAATSCGVAALEPEEPSAESDCVQGAAIWYGVFDFEHSGTVGGGDDPNGPESRYFGCVRAQCPAGLVQSAGAANHVGAKTPPFLLIHGAQDKVVPTLQSEDFHALLKSKGLSSELLVLPEVGHSFVGAQHAQTESASLAALKKTFDFFDAVIGPGSHK